MNLSTENIKNVKTEINFKKRVDKSLARVYNSIVNSKGAAEW